MSFTDPRPVGGCSGAPSRGCSSLGPRSRRASLSWRRWASQVERSRSAAACPTFQKKLLSHASDCCLGGERCLAIWAIQGLSRLRARRGSWRTGDDVDYPL